jgi:GT2 family glycosyltransferase
MFDQGLPGHLYRGFGGDFGGYANGVKVARNCLAVTGACLMTRRELFEELGGMTTTLPVNYNDIDYCLKVHRSGRRTVYDPDLVMYHFESSSRDTEVADWEKERLLERWSGVTAVDPYSNPNLHFELPRISSTLRWMIASRLPKLPGPLAKRAP